MSDKAELLHNLIVRLQAALDEITISGVSKAHARSRPLWQTFNLIANEVEASSYAELRDQFIGLCNGIKNEVFVVALRKESVRQSWIDCIAAISSVFDADNFGSPTEEVFNRHFSRRNLEVLDSISERLQNENSMESSDEELIDALNAVRDILTFLESGQIIDRRIIVILKHYLQQMETIYSHVSDFGDDAFWRLYKETFATFIQIHPMISNTEVKSEYKNHINNVASKIASKSLFGVSVAANLATIGSVIGPLLIK